MNIRTPIHPDSSVFTTADTACFRLYTHKHINGTTWITLYSTNRYRRTWIHTLRTYSTYSRLYYSSNLFLKTLSLSLSLRKVYTLSDMYYEELNRYRHIFTDAWLQDDYFFHQLLQSNNMALTSEKTFSTTKMKKSISFFLYSLI